MHVRAHLGSRKPYQISQTAKCACVCAHCAVSNHSFAVSNYRYCAGCCRALLPSLSRLGLCTVGVAWVRVYDTCGGNRYTLVIRERSRLYVTISCAIFRALSIVTQFVDIQMCCLCACVSACMCAGTRRRIVLPVCGLSHAPYCPTTTKEDDDHTFC